jgi:predicted SAM-dependent methyltransferase
MQNIKIAIYNIIKYVILNFNILFKNLKWYINRPGLPMNEKTMLHLGCGDFNIPGFINIDKLPLPHIHYRSSIEKLPFIKSNSVDLIYMSHCLEHIPQWNIPAALNEYYRILKKGGILRISVPDFKVIVEMYQKSDNIRFILPPLFGSQEYKFNFHYVAFDYKYLEELLKQCNFKEVRKWKFGDGNLKSFPDWSGRSIDVEGTDYKISLNVEAVK